MEGEKIKRTRERKMGQREMRRGGRWKTCRETLGGKDEWETRL